MMWRDEPDLAVAESSTHLALLARSSGVDPALADDVAGAIASFCRARHGSDELDHDYLLFLMARSGFLPATATLPVRDVRLMRALEQAEDSASLYEAFRRRLVRASSSNVSATGIALQVDLRKIKAGPREDLLLVWPQVFRRIAGWIDAWRKGNPEVESALINGYPGSSRRKNPLPDLFEAMVRGREKALGLPAMKLYWAG